MAGPSTAAVSPLVPKAQEELEAEHVPEPAVGDNAATEDSDGEDTDEDTDSFRTTTTDFLPEDARPAMPDLNQHQLGLDINERWGWDGSSYNSYDVVTVHGIRDDYKTAWTDAQGDWWVRNQLFEDLSTREVDYSYEIDATSTLYEPDGITQHARSLITEYAAVRQDLYETEADRPIIWICHDLGGTIVKEALNMATHDPAKYGKIAILTTAIIFLGTPHRCESMDDLEDQLYKLILLPGPEIKNGVLRRVKELARQVVRINQRFLATKLPDRAAILNVFATQTNCRNQEPSSRNEATAGPVAPHPDNSGPEDGVADPVIPFSQDAHYIGQSFEAAGRFARENVDHVALVRGEPSGQSPSSLRDVLNPWKGFPITVNNRTLHFQTRLLSLAPPTRALDTPFDPALPKSPAITWIHEQRSFATFSESGVGPRLLHLHANGSPFLDVAEVSRLLFLDLDSSRTLSASGSGRLPKKSVIYFEFDQHDSRYNTLSSLLSYLINTLAWRCWVHMGAVLIEQLTFLHRMHAWSFEDLFHLFSTLRRTSTAASEFTIFISCFDQCPADERQWFMERVLEEQGYSDREYRLVLSTSAREDLIVPSFPDEARISLNDSPALSESRATRTEGLKSGLESLIAKRPVYDQFRPQLERLMEECDNVPHLGHIILTWLGLHHRGKPRYNISDQIGRLSPPTAENVVRVFISSLDSLALRTRVETVFNWVKHAAEPWSSESLVEALTVYELRGGEGETCFEDLDVDSTMTEITDALGGILQVSLSDGDVKFSHDSFYHVPGVGSEEDEPEAAAKVNSTIAETCLRYFQLSYARKTLEALSSLSWDITDFQDIPVSTQLDSVTVSHPRASMATYAVRFWHRHYNSSGQFKPRKLADQLFANIETRAAWEEAFWLLSNPFTRIHRSYLSTLPVFAMLGLEDLVREKAESEMNQPTFRKDCWFAVTEATRAGHKTIVQQLLGLAVAVDEEELRNALQWAAGRGDAALVNVLLGKIPDLNAFQWPDNLLHQAIAAGLDDLVVAMLRTGWNINETCNLYSGVPPVGIAALRQRASTLELLLHSENKPGLTASIHLGYGGGNSVLFGATSRGDPRIIDLLLKAGSDLNLGDQNGTGLIKHAAMLCNHKAIDVLLQAGAEFKGSDDDGFDWIPPLIAAALSGSEECVRLLLAHGADSNVEWRGATALYRAVEKNHLGIVRLLLAHDPKPDMDKIPVDVPDSSQKLKPLMRAVVQGNVELVSLLIDHGAEVDFVDPNDGSFNKTPLSRACARGDLEMVKVLLAKGADINYSGDGSDTPLLSALYTGHADVVSHLLQDDMLDIKRPASDGTVPLHVACSMPTFLPELLRRGAPIDAHGTYFGTVLHAAVRFDNPTAIKLLLEHDPKPDIEGAFGDDANYEYEVGFTPLQLACNYPLPKCVKALLEGGASPVFKNKNGDDALDLLLRLDPSSEEVEECLKLLISVSYSVPGDQVDEQGRGRLHAIQDTTPLSIVQSLVEAKAPVDIQAEDGHTPLSVAVSKGNETVARYLVSQGASVNRFSPAFGSVLHLAVRRGDVSMAEFLVNSGADLDTVDPESGESLLYTALGIENRQNLVPMVRYLVDDAKVPINKAGGVEFGYPIIRAATLPEELQYLGVWIFRLLVRRIAQLDVKQLDVADSQGRRAVHLACTAWGNAALKALAKAGADLDVEDALGRKPLHFAASRPDGRCFDYLLRRLENVDINEADHDNWTPLMWAARSGTDFTMSTLLERNADVWARGYGPDQTDEEEGWSASRLLKYSGRSGWFHFPQLEPQQCTRVGADGEVEQWDDAAHEAKSGGTTSVESCNSCRVMIVGIQWECSACDGKFNLCFKCYRHRTTLHNPEHEFNPRGRLYEPEIIRVTHSRTSHSDDSEDSEGLPEKTSRDMETGEVDGGGDDASSSRSGSFEETWDFDIDGNHEGSEQSD